MFKNEYQGGISVEVFSASGKAGLSKLKNHPVKKSFDQDVKGNVYILEGSTTTAKLQYPPPEAKQHLALTQRFFVIQVFVPLSKDFAVELAMADINNRKRRIVLSSSFKDLSSTALHAKLPLSMMKRDIWVNLCFDLLSFMNEMFTNQVFKALEEFTISGTCKIRRAFTMKRQPPDTSDSPDEFTSEQLETIPASLQFSSTVNYVTQVVSVNKIRKYLGLKDPRSCETRETSGYWSSSSDDLNSARKLSKDHGQTRIAFGTKISVETPRTSRSKQGCNSARADHGRSLRTHETFQQPSSSRKAHSSKARLPSQVSSKEAVVVNGNAKMPNANDLQPSKNKTKAIEKVSKERLETERHMPKPHSLISLVDEMELSDSEFGSHIRVNSESRADKMFAFASQPHSLPRSSFTHLDKGDFKADRSSSAPAPSKEERERIQRKINRTTPTPRSANRSPKALRNFKQARSNRKRDAVLPPSSLSPDLSHSGHAYDSARYTSENLDNTALTNKSVVSLKSSDATLTGSVDTLVQNSFIADATLDHAHATNDCSFSPPTNKISPNGTSLTVSFRDVREVPGKAVLPESSNYPVGNWDDSFEARMLESMKRAVEEDMKDPNEEDEEGSSGVEDYKVKFDDSFHASLSTYQKPPTMHPQDYDCEMEEGYPANVASDPTLSRSNPREWANLFSPPLVLPSVRTQQKKESMSDADSMSNECDPMWLSDGSSSASIRSSATPGETDEEEMLDLMYDPCLNCYFDPKTGKYYELRN